AVERQAVVLPRDAERLAEASRSGAEEAPRVDRAAPLHLLHAVHGLEGTDEDSGRGSLLLADEVEAPVHAVGAVHVRVAGRAEHGAVALVLAAEAVARRILLVVGLGLDDRATDAVDEERAADQGGRDLVHAPREELATKRQLEELVGV